MSNQSPPASASRRTGRTAPSVRERRSNAVQVKPPPPATKRGRATRQRLKEALTALLEERAFHEIRLEDITREAGVRVSLFYHYFQSKIDITHEVLSELLDAFRDEVAKRPRDDRPLESIHFANQRMVALYAGNPGLMRCLVEVHEGMAPFAPMWQQITRDWNQRIAANIERQFPDALGDRTHYLALAYALAGTADSFLYAYFVLRNPELRLAYPSQEDVARFLTLLWHRTLYLENPPQEFLAGLSGYGAIASRRG